MQPLVCFQSVESVESFLAALYVTLEGFLLGVDSHMDLEAVRCEEGFAAALLVTHKRVLAPVRLLVGPQVPCCAVGPCAAFKRALVPFHLSLLGLRALRVQCERCSFNVSRHGCGAWVDGELNLVRGDGVVHIPLCHALRVGHEDQRASASSLLLMSISIPLSQVDHAIFILLLITIYPTGAIFLALLIQTDGVLLNEYGGAVVDAAATRGG